jgi:hypothetical protein
MAEVNWQEGRQSTTPQGNGQRRLSDDARDAREHAQAFASSLGNSMKNVDEMVRSVTERNPYAALGAALGVGFILGGGIPPALIRGVVGFAGRYAMAAVLSMVVAGETAKETAKKEVHEEGRSRE